MVKKVWVDMKPAAFDGFVEMLNSVGRVGDTMVIVPVTVMKCPTGVTGRRKVSFGSQFENTDHHVRESMMAGA